MKSTEECVLAAMDGSDKELLAFLPYILKDSWELGSDSESIAGLIPEYFSEHKNLEVLDLGCGKGAVSVKIAGKLGCKCLGIDALPEFVGEAVKKAREFGVQNLCRFVTGDIRQQITSLPAFDVVILGSIGPVFGDYSATLTALKRNLKDDGIIIIDDGYVEDSSPYNHPVIFKKQEILNQIESSGMHLVEERGIAKSDMKESNDFIFDNLKRRCSELIEKYPDKRKLFEDYVARQVQENDALENKVVCATFVIKRNYQKESKNVRQSHGA